MTTWTLTAENATAAGLRKLHESDNRIPVFPETGSRDEHIYYSGDEADFAITVDGDGDIPGYGPRWMYPASELLAQYGIISRVIPGNIDLAMRDTRTDAGWALREAERAAEREAATCDAPGSD